MNVNYKKTIMRHSSSIEIPLVDLRENCKVSESNKAFIRALTELESEGKLALKDGKIYFS